MEFSLPIYVPSKREREESSRWRKAGHKIAHILSALCMRLNCFRVLCSCNIPEMNQRSSRFHPCPPDFELSHTRICTCVCMSVYIIVFTTANVNTMRVYRGLCGASLFSVWMGTVFMKRKLQRAGTKGSLCDVQLIKGLQLSGNESQNLFRPVQTDTLASLLPFSFSFWITL